MRVPFYQCLVLLCINFLNVKFLKKFVPVTHRSSIIYFLRHYFIFYLEIIWRLKLTVVSCCMLLPLPPVENQREKKHCYRHMGLFLQDFVGTTQSRPGACWPQTPHPSPRDAWNPCHRRGTLCHFHWQLLAGQDWHISLVSDPVPDAALACFLPPCLRTNFHHALRAQL